MPALPAAQQHDAARLPDGESGANVLHRNRGLRARRRRGDARRAASHTRSWSSARRRSGGAAGGVADDAAVERRRGARRGAPRRRSPCSPGLDRCRGRPSARILRGAPDAFIGSGAGVAKPWPSVQRQLSDEPRIRPMAARAACGGTATICAGRSTTPAPEWRGLEAELVERAPDRPRHAACSPSTPSAATPTPCSPAPRSPSSPLAARRSSTSTASAR